MSREWMYRRSTPQGDYNPLFLQGLESFIEFACSQPAFMDGQNIRCPCRKCRNMAYRDVGTVPGHVKKNGFEFNYHVWVFQGERRVVGVDQSVSRGGGTHLVHTCKKARRGEGRPDYVPQTVCDTDKAHERSRTTKKNRLSEPGGEGTRQIKHRGGSRSVAAHAEALATEKGVPVEETLYDTFQMIHFINGVYTDAKSQRIGDEVERRIAEVSRDLLDGTPAPAVDRNVIYLDVVGGVSSKNCIFGLDSLYTTSQSSSPTGPSSHNPQSHVSHITQDDVRAQLESHRQELQAEFETRLHQEREVHRQESNQLRAQIAAIEALVRDLARPPPS